MLTERVPYSKEFRDLYNANKVLARVKFVDGVRAISPEEFGILAVCRYTPCERHADQIKFQYVTVCYAAGSCGDYTDDFAGPGVYIHSDNKTATVFGHMNRSTQTAFTTGTHKALCGCVMTRVPDEEVPPLVEGNFTCRYMGCTVDER